MYEELVKRLRAHNGWALNKTLDEAADAIEELQRQIDGWVEPERKTLIKSLPRWIPVKKRLPKDGTFVLVCNDDGHLMIAKHETETFEWYYKYTNYDFDIWDNYEQGPVCYWMPLPEPPKDDGTDVRMENEV